MSYKQNIYTIKLQATITPEAPGKNPEEVLNSGAKSFETYLERLFDKADSFIDYTVKDYSIEPSEDKLHGVYIQEIQVKSVFSEDEVVQELLSFLSVAGAHMHYQHDTITDLQVTVIDRTEREIGTGIPKYYNITISAPIFYREPDNEYFNAEELHDKFYESSYVWQDIIEKALRQSDIIVDINKSDFDFDEDDNNRSTVHVALINIYYFVSTFADQEELTAKINTILASLAERRNKKPITSMSYNLLIDPFNLDSEGLPESQEIEIDVSVDPQIVSVPEIIEIEKADEHGDPIKESLTEEITEEFGTDSEQRLLNAISQAIKSEEDTVMFYTEIVNEFPISKPVFEDIISEEQKHIGQLEVIRNQCIQKLGKNVKKGAIEAEHQLATGTSEEPDDSRESEESAVEPEPAELDQDFLAALDLKNERDLLLKANEYKCKLCKYDIHKASDWRMLLADIENVYNCLCTRYGADNIQFWGYSEGGVRVKKTDGTVTYIEDADLI